jgi:hypothetical protein
MFIVNQSGTNSINVDFIEQIVATEGKCGYFSTDTKQKEVPRIIAVIDSKEEVLGEYETLAEAKKVLSLISLFINKNFFKIEMPPGGFLKHAEKVKAMMNNESIEKSLMRIIEDVLKSDNKAPFGSFSFDFRKGES